MRGIEYIELTPDSVMPEMFRDFSRRQEAVLSGAGDPDGAGGTIIVDWDDDDIGRVCASMLAALANGGAVLGAYVSEEDDPGAEDGGDRDFTSVEYEEEPEPPKPYDWYIEDEEEPPCRAVVGFCVLEPSRPSGNDPDVVISELSALCVSEKLRRKGIGKGLFRRAVRLARTLDANRLYIPALPDRDTLEFFKAVGCGAADRTGQAQSDPRPAAELAPQLAERAAVPLEYDLYPRGANGACSLTIEEYQTMAGQILDSLPKEFFNQLNGGVIVSPETKIHPKSVPGAPMLIMGEYTRSSMMGRMIYLYYGSFIARYGNIPRSAQREHLRGIIVHEFRHHMEWLSGTRELEKEDERGLRAYIARFVKKPDGRKKPGRK